MATVIPFRGLRYNQDKIKNLADVVTPPYDVIDEAGQDFYYKRHPYNIIRLEYGKIFPGDDINDNRYIRAAADFDAWLKEDVLVPENFPAIYLYEHEFTLGLEKKVRSGFICGVKLEPYEKGIVLPHEETMPRHKADRLELMRACRASFSPIFSLYADRENKVDLALREAVKGLAPDVQFTDENGEVHRIWAVADPGAISAVQQAMSDKRIFIADGHHRYETALNYKRERKDGGGDRRENRTVSATSSCSTTPDGSKSCAFEADTAYNYVMMTLVNLYDPGLAVLPTHRLIRNLTDLDKECLVEEIKENFTVEEFPLKPDRSNFQDFLKLLSERGRVCPDNSPPGGRTEAGPHDCFGLPLHNHVFGLYAGDNRLYLLSLIDKIKPEEMIPKDKSPAWQGLDVSVLHTLIIEKCLGISGELRAKAEHITYTREEEGALKLVDSGVYQLVFFVNPTLVEEVTEVAARGEKMPQKSTFFYPKVVSGVVIYGL